MSRAIPFKRGAVARAVGQAIVSLVPSHTETLYALGLGARVVGRTRFCIAPAQAAAVPSVGGTKDATAARVLALGPDLVVADRDENPKALVEAIQEAGVEVLWSEIGDVEDAARFVAVLGARCGVEAAGLEAAARIRHARRQARREAAARGGDLPAFVPIWHAPWMTFDATSYPHAILADVGIRNVFGGHRGSRYFEVDDRQVVESGARWTLLPTEPFPFHKRRAAVDTTPLGECGLPERVRIMDGEALTWFGVRTAAALGTLSALARHLTQHEGPR